MPDAVANFGYSTVATAPSPATSGTSLVVQTGEGARCPAVPFNAPVWPAGAQPAWAAGGATGGNVEIVRVTARSTDTLTIVRAQEGTTARTIVAGDQIHFGPTKFRLDPQRKVVGNTAYTIGSGPSADGTDKTIYDTFSFTTTLTANRIITLCAANAVAAGTRIRIEDGAGVVTPALTVAAIEIQIKPAGSDTVAGVAAATNFEVIRDTRGSVLLESDGTSDWKIIAVTPHTRYEVFTATVTAGWRKSLVATSVKFRGIGGGGAGGSGQKAIVANPGSGGGGGGAGGLTEMTLAAAQFGATSDVTVGAGGTAGGTRTSTGTGAAGGGGGFSFLLLGNGQAAAAASGGGGGAGGVAGGGAGGTPSTGGGGSSHVSQLIAGANTLIISIGSGGAGADGTGNTAAGIGFTSPFGGAGGGGGGGGGTGAAYVAAGVGGSGSFGFGSNGDGVVGGAAGATGGGAAGAAVAITSLITAGSAALGGGGGGGGGPRNGVTPGAAGVDGSAGALYGGGGGGGSAGFGATGVNSNGNGGAGAAGVLEIVTYR